MGDNGVGSGTKGVSVCTSRWPRDASEVLEKRKANRGWANATVSVLRPFPKPPKDTTAVLTHAMQSERVKMDCCPPRGALGSATLAGFSSPSRHAETQQPRRAAQVSAGSKWSTTAKWRERRAPQMASSAPSCRHHTPAGPAEASGEKIGCSQEVSAPSSGTGASTSTGPPAISRSYIAVAQPGHTSWLSSHASAMPLRSRRTPSSTREASSQRASPATYSSMARLRRCGGVGAHGKSHSIGAPCACSLFM
eukprot:scaffold2031_cov112-Isochrysis_galbana.AAC.5